MGLNGLISRNVAGLVRSFKISGEWNEGDLEEFAKVGRIPDTSMMLNMVVRTAIEKMEKLDSFRYFPITCKDPTFNTNTLPAGSLTQRCFRPCITA